LWLWIKSDEIKLSTIFVLIRKTNDMYKIEITTAKSTTVKKFPVKSDAQKEKKSLIKSLNLTKQKGFWGNSKTGTELSTNY
jgi:hypothetical protein